MDRISFYLAPVIVLLICSLSSTGVLAETDSSFTLIDLKAIYVDAPILDPEIEEGGVNSRRIKKDLERRLDAAGIQVLSETDFNRFKLSKRYPMARLHIDVSFGKMDADGRDIYALTVQALQQVFLAHKTGVKIWTPTWESRRMIISSSPAEVQPHITEAVDLFIRDYLSVNSP